MDIKLKKTLDQMENEAKSKHWTKLLFIKDGQTYATFRKPGEIIRDHSGRTYLVHDDGSLRRVMVKG
jgi:hypothetical protein